MSQSVTVTFQTILDLTKETPKAVKIYSMGYLPKALVTYKITGTTTREYTTRGKTVKVACQIVDITMPKWLHEKM